MVSVCGLKDALISCSEPLDAEREAAEAVFFEDIDAGLVEHQVRAKAHRRVEGALQGLQIGVVVGVVGQRDVEVARRLVEGVIALAVDGAGEDLRGVVEYRGGAVAVVNVEVEDRDALDGPVVEERGGGDGEVIEDAEAFAAVSEGVVGAAGEVAGDAEAERGARRGEGAEDAGEGASDEPGRPGQADVTDLGRRQLAAEEGVDPRLAVGVAQVRA